MIQRIMILPFPRPTDQAHRAIAIGLLASCALPPAPLAAQDTVSQPVVQSTANPADPEELVRAASQRQLTEALGFIAADGSNWFALSQAGRAALALGDARAAVGFLARAEALAPRDPVIKAALGAAMVQLEDPQQAMRYFEAAIAAGGLDRAYLGDRGLAFDLLGDQRRAQADYAVAAQSNPSAELTRRHAISLGISGQPDEAIRMLAPLLRAQDRAAWRSRAMIVAMNGRPDEARQIARTTMPPQLAEALDPYFALMDRLTPDQLAAASHFGRFPTYDALRGQPSRANAARVAAATTTAAPEPASTRNRDRSSRTRDRNRNSSNRTSRRAPTASPAPRPAPTPVRVAVVPRATEPNVPAASSAPPPPAAPTLRPPVQQVASELVPTTSVPAAPPPPAATVASGSVPASITVRSPATGPVAGPPDTEPQYASAVPSTAAATASPQPDVIYYPDPAARAEPAAEQLAALAPVPQPDPTPAATPPPVPTTQLAGWSLDSVIGSIEIPDTELAASANALSLAEMEAIAAEQRRAAQAAAEARAAARAAERTEARTRAAAEAEARRREEARVAAEAEATRRRSPARFWVQVATGSNTSALAFDCRRLAREYAASFRGQSCATAAWNRTNRLVVGPFRNMAAAREWESAYRRAGGDGFAWASDAGEEVTPVGRGR